AGASGNGGEPVKALAPDQLRALLPERIGDLARTSISASRNGGMGMEISEASATYATADGSRTVEVEITDLAAMGGMMAMASSFGIEQSKETSDGFQRTYTRDGQIFNEEWSNARKRGEYGVTVAN